MIFQMAILILYQKLSYLKQRVFLSVVSVELSLKHKRNPKFRRNTFAVSHWVLEFENALHCGRRMRKREVATLL
jgi:hypothetical protein